MAARRRLPYHSPHERHHHPTLDPGQRPSPAGNPLHRPRLPRRHHPPRPPRPVENPDQHPALDQDRRLPRGLRLLPPIRRLRSRRPRRQTHGCRRRPRRSPRRQTRRRHPLLHGRRLALPQRPRSGRRLHHGGRRPRPGPGKLRHPGHAHRPASRAAERRRPGLLQPQSGHLARILRRHNHHPNLPGPAGHAGPHPRGRNQRVLRRHRRHGRAGIRPRRPHRRARQPAQTPRKRPHQRARPRRRHPARPHPPDRRHRFRPHRGRRPNHHAHRLRPPLRRPRSHDRRSPGPLLPGRRQLDLLRPPPAHHPQSRRRPGPHAPRPAWPATA